MVLVIALLGVGVLTTRPETEMTSLVLSGIQIVPLLWRRRHPGAVLLAVSGTHAAQVLLIDYPVWGQVAFPIAIYSAARFGNARWGRVGLIIGVVASMVATLDWWDLDANVPVQQMATLWLLLMAFVLSPWAVGTTLRTRQEYLQAVIERGRRIEEEATTKVALAASEERARIAREMHDVVAHGLTTMIVQADGARYAATARPEVAAEALEDIAEAGRDALKQMRQMLGLLRSDATGTAPAAGLAEIPALVDSPDVDSTLIGLDRPVSSSAALTTYRVVQEALSNVRKHAGPNARVRLSVTVDEDPDGDIEVLVEDDGHGAAADDDGHGLGLMGMRERIDAQGGTLEVGPRPGGGFRVHAKMPR